MTSVLCPPLTFQGVGFGGEPLPFGYLYSYIAGTSTPQATWTDSTQVQQNLNPVKLNVNGQAPVWLDPTLTYKFKLTDALGNQVYTTDQVQGSLTAAALSTILTQAYLGAILNPQTPAEAAAGVTPVNLAYLPGIVDRYATNTTPGTTDMSGAFTKAVSVAQRNGGIVTYGATAPYLVAAPINATFFSSANQKGVIIQGPDGSLDSGALSTGNMAIIAKHSGVAVFDCTGNDSIKFRDVAITCDPTTYPVTGILFARNQLGPASNSQVNRLDNVRIAGKFSNCCYYNYGSEDDVLSGCYFANFATTANTRTRVYTANNISSLASAFTVDNLGNTGNICSGAASCIDHNDFGCQDWNSGGTNTADCIYLEQSDSFKKYGGWAFSASATVNGRSLVYVDMTNAASNFGVISGLTGENGTFLQANGILFSNNSHVPTGWNISDSALNNATNAIAAGALVTLDNFQMRGLISETAISVSVPGILQNSIIDASTAMSLTIGTSIKNRLTGDTSRFTVTTRTNDFWIDTGTTNKTWTPNTSALTVTGALTKRADYLLNGSKAEFSIILAAATSIVCAAGIAITGLPFAIGGAVGYSSDVLVYDQTTHTVIGQGYVTGSSIFLPAINVTTDTVIITGSYFVA